MTSRERVLAALRHEEGDRVPIDFGAFRSSGIHASTYARVRRLLGLPATPPRLYDLMQQLAEPDPDVLERFRADVVQVHRLAPSFGIPIDRWKDGRLPDGTPVLVPEGFDPILLDDGSREIRDGGTVIARMPSGGNYFDRVHAPLAAAESAADLDRLFDWPLIDGREIAFIRDQAERARATGRAVLACFGGNVLEMGHALFGYEDFMLRIAAEPALIEAFGERVADWHVRNLDRFLPAVDGLVDVIACGDDLGAQAGLQLSIDDYRRLIKPYQRRVYERVRRGTKAYLFLHTCGSVVDVLPDLIEIGVQILNPVQLSARGMEPERLKREFGRDLVFWGGGCDTQTKLPRSTPAEIRREAQRNMAAFKPGGGHVFTQVHNILADVPEENVVALYDAAFEAGRYGSA
ncbi:MAG: methyltransferase [Planctomycetes bacterium]|nr:methyltransferase [Planctomycetota bacterium]